MRAFTGRVIETQLDTNGAAAAWITCPPAAIPQPGQALLAWSPADGDAPLATALFSAGRSEGGFLAAAPVPRAWEPGTELHLRGPLGHGFSLPAAARRLALAALGESVARLLPLAYQALERDAAVALYAGCPLPSLPSDLEVHPLSALPEALPWADFLALDLPLAALPTLRSALALPPGQRLPCPGQALLLTPMPCGGLAECGACAVPAGRSWKLACKDGPVFDLKELDW